MLPMGPATLARLLLSLLVCFLSAGYSRVLSPWCPVMTAAVTMIQVRTTTMVKLLTLDC